MYIDIYRKSNKDKYNVLIFQKDTVRNLSSNNLEKLVKNVGILVKTTKDDIYVDSRGFGIVLTDFLDSQGIQYIKINHEYLDLDKIVQ